MGGTRIWGSVGEQMPGLEGLGGGGCSGWGDPNLGDQWIGEPKFGVVWEVRGGWGPQLGSSWVGNPYFLLGF